MTMLKKPQSGGAGASPPRGPIRQNVSLPDDDEEDDFFEYSRDGGNTGMSIKDIMARENKNSGGSSSKTDAKQQAKMWGIDIDKFTD